MFDKKNNKLAGHHGLLAWVIALLLFLLLIVLVFKTGMMVGESKSYFSPYKAGNHYKNFSGHMGGKFSGWKKSEYQAFEVKAEAMGMTIEELKKYLIDQKKSEYEDFEAKAEAMGMTLEEYKSYLAGEKSEKIE